MRQEFADTLWYGNEGAAPEEFTGFAPRFNSLSAGTAENLIIPGVGAGAPTGFTNTSIWLITWGSLTTHGIYPKGSTAGMLVEDKGQVTIESIDGAGGRMEAFRTHYKWDLGLAVRDWRGISRIQFDVASLTKDAASGADLVDLMVCAIARTRRSAKLGRQVFYATPDIQAWIRRQARNSTKGSTLSVDRIEGKWITSLDGIPIKTSDSILTTEAAITA